MTPSNVSTDPVENRVSGLIAAVEALRPLIALHEDALAKGPDIPQEIAEALEHAGLTRLWLPQSVGGAELMPLDYFRVIEALAKQNASVAWCASIASTGCRVAGLVDQSVAAELLGNGGFVAGSLGPTGKAIRDGDGWRITGRWSWGSFITYSKITVAVCIEHENGVACSTPEGAPVLRAVLIPTSKVTIIKNWDGSGLRSSGSHDFAIDNAFVEAAHTFTMTRFITRSYQPGALYTLPFITMFALGITAVSLGIARGAIEALIDLAQHKRVAGTQMLLRERANVQATIAEAETMLCSARSFLFEAVGALWEQEASGRPENMKQRALARMASCNVVQTAKKIADMCYSAAGGAAAHEKAPFGCQLRDSQVIAQHLAFSPENLETAGRVLLGMGPGTFRF